MSGIFNRDTGEPIEPMGWQGSGIDFEVAGHGPWEWTAYDEDVLVGASKARTRIGLIWALWWARRRLS